MEILDNQYLFEKNLTKPIALESYQFMPRCKKLPYQSVRGWISKVVVEVALLLVISSLRLDLSLEVNRLW